jgi:hypothetical protein
MWILRDLTNEVPGARSLDTARIITGQPATNATNLLCEFDDGGGLHLNRDGHEKLAKAVLRVIQDDKGGR